MVKPDKLDKVNITLQTICEKDINFQSVVFKRKL